MCAFVHQRIFRFKVCAEPADSADMATLDGLAAVRLRLPAELTISCAHDTLVRLRDVSKEARALVLDAADVVRVDTAGLQLLLASRRACLEAKCEWTLANPVGILVDNARRLGLRDALGLGSEE